MSAPATAAPAQRHLLPAPTDPQVFRAWVVAIAERGRHLVGCYDVTCPGCER